MIRSALKEGILSVAFKSVRPRWRKQTMSCLHSATTNVPTAGIIVIGDEILKGQVRDSNSHFIISRLYNIGVRVMKVSVVGDDIDEISNEVRKFSGLYTYVITSGGIGPTHDDVTFEGVAKAFQENVYPHPELVKICSDFYNTTDLSSPAMKLASVPMSAKLKYGFDPVHNQRSKFPNISVKNVYIFPGVPPLLEKSFAMLCEDLFGGSGSKFFKSEFFINENEVSIAENLSTAVGEFPSVAFGSYPQYDNSYYCLKLTVEANNPELLSKAVSRLKELLPHNCLVDYDSEPLQSSYEKIESLGLQHGMSHVSAALQDVFQAVTSSSTETMALCIDASIRGVATLHLLHATVKKLERPGSVLTVFIKNEKQDALASDKFLKNCVSRYVLHVIGDPSASPTGLKMTMSTLHSSLPGLKVIITGCHCSSTEFKDTLLSFYSDPSISVCAPVSSWTDAQTIQFIKKLNLPYLKDH